MTKQQFLSHCLSVYGTSPDYPFDDWMESAVLGIIALAFLIVYIML